MFFKSVDHLATVIEILSAEIPAIASKLNYKPSIDSDIEKLDKSKRVIFRTKDGDNYDLFHMLNALIDKIER